MDPGKSPTPKGKGKGKGKAKQSTTPSYAPRGTMGLGNNRGEDENSPGHTIPFPRFDLNVGAGEGGSGHNHSSTHTPNRLNPAIAPYIPGNQHVEPNDHSKKTLQYTLRDILQKSTVPTVSDMQSDAPGPSSSAPVEHVASNMTNQQMPHSYFSGFVQTPSGLYAAPNAALYPTLRPSQPSVASVDETDTTSSSDEGGAPSGSSQPGSLDVFPLFDGEGPILVGRVVVPNGYASRGVYVRSATDMTLGIVSSGVLGIPAEAHSSGLIPIGDGFFFTPIQIRDVDPGNIQPGDNDPAVYPSQMIEFSDHRDERLSGNLIFCGNTVMHLPSVSAAAPQTLQNQQQTAQSQVNGGGHPPANDLGPASTAVMVQNSQVSSANSAPMLVICQDDPFFGDPALVAAFRPFQDPYILNFQNTTYHLPRNPLPPNVYDHSVMVQRSNMLQALTNNLTGQPSTMIALNVEYFPFVPIADEAERPNYGVIRFENIPFGTTRAELIAFVSRYVAVLNDTEEPVHIIMDRTTSKTNNAFVEFNNMAEAAAVVEKIRSGHHGRVSRIGDRAVEVQLSSQAALMREIFPHAARVMWQANHPIVGPPVEGPGGIFKGFVTEEEMQLLLKQAEAPHHGCPQRSFETLISVLKKMPWASLEFITVKHRFIIFRTTMDLLRLLKQQIESGKDEVNLSFGLFKRLRDAAMRCPGFSVIQKDSIALVSNMTEIEQRGYGQPRFAASWVHLQAVGIKPQFPLDVVEWYVALLREETQIMITSLPPSVRNQIMRRDACSDQYFGFMWVELWRPFGRVYDDMTLAECASRELAVIERIITRALLN